MVNAQEWLESQEGYNTKEKRTKIRELDIRHKDLAGSLNLTDFINLTELDCRGNKLTELNLTGLSQLEKISCCNNYLTNIVYPSNANKLTYLKITNNNLSEQDLAVFSKLVNLEELKIGSSDKERINQGTYNRFAGSLETLKNLTKLKWLDIKNTDINSGWEYLPASVKNINYSNKERPASKVKEIAEQLKWIGKGFGGQQLKSWIDFGLQPQDYGFACYLTRKDYQPQATLNLGELRERYNKSQAWLDENYPKEERSEVYEIHLTEPSLVGELDLGDFTSIFGVKVLVSLSVDETKLTFKNKPWSAEIIKLIQAQEYVDQQYPNKEAREKVTELDISNKNLERNLDLSDFISLKELRCSNNKLTSLNLSNCNQLEWIDFSYNQLTNLTLPNNPTNLKELNLGDNNFPNQKLIDKFGSCFKCYQPNTSWKWCQPCREKEWQAGIKHLTRQELVEKFNEKKYPDYKKINWIPHEEFEVEKDEQGHPKLFAQGGFSKIYKAKCKKIKKYNKYASEDVVLKSLTNSQNLTLEFLNEIANTKLVDGGGRIVKCYGISQDPEAGNYLMVMQYKEGGNLRQILQNKNKGLSLEDKISNLWIIASGLYDIHHQNLIHRDFHSGNIVGFSITDLGLCQPVNSQKQEGKIFGVLPYVAPEVLQGQPYTQASDIYSWGIIAYELFANSYPYTDKNLTDTSLTLAICNGLRPEIDKVLIPQLFKDLIKRCWEADPQKRPNTGELYGIIDGWWDYYNRRVREDIPFYHQYQALKEEYNNFSQNTPYQIHPTAITTSKMIDTKQIVQLLQDPTKQQEALELTDELKKMVNDFIQTRKKMIKNEEDKETRNKIKELNKKLREKGLSRDNLDKIIKYCERFIDKEEKIELQAQIEQK